MTTYSSFPPNTPEQDARLDAIESEELLKESQDLISSISPHYQGKPMPVVMTTCIMIILDCIMKLESTIDKDHAIKCAHEAIDEFGRRGSVRLTGTALNTLGGGGT